MHLEDKSITRKVANIGGGFENQMPLYTHSNIYKKPAASDLCVSGIGKTIKEASEYSTHTTSYNS